MLLGRILISDRVRRPRPRRMMRRLRERRSRQGYVRGNREGLDRIRNPLRTEVTEGVIVERPSLVDHSGEMIDPPDGVIEDTSGRVSSEVGRAVAGFVVEIEQIEPGGDIDASRRDSSQRSIEDVALVIVSGRPKGDGGVEGRSLCVGSIAGGIDPFGTLDIVLVEPRGFLEIDGGEPCERGDGLIDGTVVDVVVELSASVGTRLARHSCEAVDAGHETIVRRARRVGDEVALAEGAPVIEFDRSEDRGRHFRRLVPRNTILQSSSARLIRLTTQVMLVERCDRPLLEVGRVSDLVCEFRVGVPVRSFREIFCVQPQKFERDPVEP